jgi:hypothetical protein
LFSFAGQLALNVPEDQIAVEKAPSSLRSAGAVQNALVETQPPTNLAAKNGTFPKITTMYRLNGFRSIAELIILEVRWTIVALLEISRVRAAFFMWNLANVAELSSEKFVP